MHNDEFVNDNSIDMIKITISIVFLCLFAYLPAFGQCNGDAALCDRPFNEVAFLTTHNAYNSAEDDYASPNHNLSIVSQLNDGVRGLMIDVYDNMGVASVFHSAPFLGSRPLVEFLIEIREFLEENQNEVVTIILECYTTADMIESEINASELTDYLYTHDVDTGWPTLQEMIDDNARLVILSDVNDASADQAWYHYMWDLAVETHYSNNSIADFSCNFNRGDAENDLFILNHFITDASVGIGEPDSSLIANSNPYFIERVLECQTITEKFPNFVTVDFHELGDCHAVVNQLNGVSTSVDAYSTIDTKLSVYPNPSNNVISVQQMGIAKDGVQIFNVLGQSVHELIYIQSLDMDEIRVDVSQLDQGVYMLKTKTQATLFLHQP